MKTKTKTKNRKNNNRLSVYTRLFLDVDTICEIADKGIEWNYNRQLCSEAVRTLPEGRVYPVIQVLEHHHRFFEPCETHMRLVIALPGSLACADVPMDYFMSLKPYLVVKRGEKVIGGGRPVANDQYELVVKGNDRSQIGRVRKALANRFPDVRLAS